MSDYRFRYSVQGVAPMSGADLAQAKALVEEALRAALPGVHRVNVRVAAEPKEAVA